MPTKLMPRRVATGKPEATSIILNGVEGWGKTTAAAYAPKPIILMARGETGFDTLRRSNLVPDVDSQLVESWPDLLAIVAELATTKYQTVALDALGGFERMCQEHVCAAEFDGKWGERGFIGYQRGFDLTASEWLKLLQGLDALRAKTRANVLLLSHAKPIKSRDPIAPEFDRWCADCHPKVWAATSRWADTVLFARFVTVVTEPERKGQKVRGIGGTERVIETEHRDAWDAKNRFGMDQQIQVEADPTKTWATIWAAICGVKSNVKVPTEIPE